MPSPSTATSSNSPARYASPAPDQVAFLSVRQPSARGSGPASSAAARALVAAADADPGAVGAADRGGDPAAAAQWPAGG